MSFFNTISFKPTSFISKEYIVTKTLDYLPYTILLLICFYLLNVAYFRYTLGFWACQPVYHNYGIFYGFRRQGVINKELPERNRYTNFENIQTIPYTAVLSSQTFTKSRWVKLLREHFLNAIVDIEQENGKYTKSINSFVPTEAFLLPQFQGHNSECYVSFYKEPVKKIDVRLNDTQNNNTVINDEEIIGTISTRPVHIHIHNGDERAKLDAYYVDYLCVHKNYRKKGLAAQLIQTHEYNQSYANRQISVSLFKKEGTWVKGIVPLCTYMTYGFNVKKWTKPPSIPPNEGGLIDITIQNMNMLWDFLKEEEQTEKQFDISIKTDIGNMMEMVKTNNVFVKALLLPAVNEICAVYFFKKSCVLIEDTLEILTCYASIKTASLQDKLFIKGFKISFWDIAAKHSFGYSAVENLSHNHILIENLIQRTKPTVISPTAYFFYNFAYNEFRNTNRVLILI